VSLFIKCCHGESAYGGLATDVSEVGMRIQPGRCHERNDRLKMKIPVKYLSRSNGAGGQDVQHNEFCDTMGVQVVRSSKRYLKLIQCLSGELKTA
jgi:hypothetical protein